MPALVSALKREDLPTLGRPTMPHWRLMGDFRIDRGNPRFYGLGWGSVELPVGAGALAHPQHLPVALEHDGVHAEGDGALEARVAPVGLQRVAHLGAGEGAIT